MKIAINTIMDGANYGNRLQNYALQIVLEQLGCDVETLRKTTSRDLIGLKKIRYTIGQILKKLLGKDSEWNHNIRNKRFRKFNKKYINLSNYTLGYCKANDHLELDYDYFISGSDQIWNTKFEIISEDIDNYLNAFAHGNKRIAYAASFGTNEIEEHYKDLFENELKKYKAISVREYTGKNIVNILCGREAKVVLDPTMLLSRKKWLELARKPKYIKDETFIVTYFMSGRSKEISQHIKKIKEFYGVEQVINLDIEFLGDKEIENHLYYQTDPAEFIWLIANAKCVLTDSFHSTVFSIMFNKPFSVFERKAVEIGNNMGSRIDTLLTRFGLEEYRDDIGSPKLIPHKYDKEAIDRKLNEDRKESLMFLKKELGIKG